MDGRENLLKWERLWSDLVQEEIRRNTRDGVTSIEAEDEFALVEKGLKVKGENPKGEAESNQRENNKDLSKIVENATRKY